MRHTINALGSFILGQLFLAFSFFSDLAKPGFYLKRFRIKAQISNDKFEYDNGTYCVYSIYCPKGLETDHKVVLQTLNSMKINVIVIYVGADNKKDLQYLSENAFLSVIRKNIGRDFGAYKDGINILLSNELYIKKLKRVILLNDSCFVRTSGLNDLFSELCVEQYDVVAAFENFQYQYHLQSFCLSFSRKVFLSKKFRSFWFFYLPLSSRPHSINKGEKGLTKTIQKFTNNINVIFPLDKINGIEFHESDTTDMDEMPIMLFPSEFKAKILNDRRNFVRTLINCRSTDQSIIESFKLTESLTQEHFEILSLADINAVHYIAPVYSQYFNCPIIKKDIFQRQVYRTLIEANFVLDRFFRGEENKNLYLEALQTVRARSYATSGAGIVKKALLSKGYI